MQKTGTPGEYNRGGYNRGRGKMSEVVCWALPRYVLLCAFLPHLPMQAGPPFAITGVSAAIPLVAGTHPRVPAWDHISFPMSLQLLEDSGQLMIGYGSGDQVPRVKFMPLSEALGLFSGSEGSSVGNAGEQQQQTAVAGAVDGGGEGVGGKLAGKLAAGGLGMSPGAIAAANAAVAAVEEAMGLRPAAAGDGAAAASGR